MTELVVSRPSEGRIIGVVGDLCRFLTIGDETGGRYACWEAIVPPGGGPPPHLHHREVEGFYILEGELSFEIGERRVVATAGMFVNLPIGVRHSFRNESQHPTRMLTTVAPAGLEQMFFEVGTPLPPGSVTAPPPTAADIENLRRAAPRYGIEIFLPPH